MRHHEPRPGAAGRGRRRMPTAHTVVRSTHVCQDGTALISRRAREDRSAVGQPMSTAAATTVVHRPCLSPTAVWVTFWVRTIWFDSR